MSDLYWLTDEQMARLRPHFPRSHGKPRVDDRRVLSGIIFVNRNGLRWRDAPAAYGPHKTLYNRWKRWSEAGVFIRMMQGLSGGKAERRTVMIDATSLEAHHTASSLGVKRMARPVGKRFVSDVLSSLRKRIRPFDIRSLAKMEIRASWSS